MTVLSAMACASVAKLVAIENTETAVLATHTSHHTAMCLRSQVSRSSTPVAYLLALAAVLLVMKVFDGFERQPVEKPSKRWVIVPDDRPAGENLSDTESQKVPAVESEGQNPAA